MSRLVSVVIPAYNAAAYVAEAVESALAQDHAEKEVIVVNDGSTDDTLAALARFGNRIRIVDQSNAGPPAARNAGLDAAHGDYIAFLDADDVWIQGKLGAQVRHIEANPDVDTVFTHWHVWPAEADGRFVPPPELIAHHVGDEVDAANSGWLYNRLLFDCQLLTTTVMLRRSAVEAIGRFDPRFWNGDDYDFWLRASRVGKITKLASVSALYRVVPGSVSRKPKPINYEYEVLRTALGRWGAVGPRGERTELQRIERRIAQLNTAHGYAHLQNGDPKVALSAFLGNVKLEPSNPRLWLNIGRAAVALVRGRRN